MSNNTLLLIWFAWLIVAIVLRTKTNFNLGVLLIAGAYVIGTFLCGISASDLIKSWNTTILFVFVSTSLFFGFTSVNGTMKVLANKMLYATRKFMWFIPVAFYVIGFLVSTCGAGPITTCIILPPVGYALAMQAGFNPLLISLGVACGGAVGNAMPWTSGFATRSAFFEQLGLADEHLVTFTNETGWVMAILFTVIFALAYVGLKGWKNEGADFSSVMEKPADFNPVQKKTVILMGVIIGLIIVPLLIQLVAPNPATKWMSTNMNIQMLCIVFCCIAFFMNLGDVKQVYDRVPWMTMIQACGCSLYVTIAVKLGVADVVTSWLSGGLPGWAIVALCFFASGVISFFSGYYTIMALFVVFIPAVCEATGANMLAMGAATYCGCMLTAISPFSTCGAILMSGMGSAMGKEKQDAMFMPSFYFTIVCLVVGTLLACTPIMSLFGAQW